MQQPTPSSPSWSSNLKLVVALTMVAIIAGLLIHFQTLIPPLLIVFILVYLLHPVARFISQRLHVSWRVAVTIIYLFIVIILLGLLTLGGVSLVQPIQNLVSGIQEIISNLPALVARLSSLTYSIGPFTLDLKTLDLNDLSQRLLSIVEPLLGRTGEILSAIAGGAAEVIGWTLFVILVSFFIMIESTGLRGDLLKIEVPGYTEDFNRLSEELGRIWNAFLRGQLIIFVLTVIIYVVVLTLFGVKYAIGLAILAGLAKFLPYIGPAIVWIVLTLVSYFQAYKLFGMQPIPYTLLVLITSMVLDQTFDSVIAPSILARSLKVHPAAVLVAALLAADLFGLLGVVIAAPMLATIALFVRYAMRKLFDMNPWPSEEEEAESTPAWMERLMRLRNLFARKEALPQPTVDPMEERNPTARKTRKTKKT